MTTVAQVRRWLEDMRDDAQVVFRMAGESEPLFVYEAWPNQGKHAGPYYIEFVPQEVLRQVEAEHGNGGNRTEGARTLPQDA